MFLGNTLNPQAHLRQLGKLMLLATIACFASTIGWDSAMAENPPSNAPDQVVTEAVEHALLVDESIPSDFIDVSTHQGVITLIGQVPHYRAKQRAAQLVETVKGVESVINGLTVKNSQRPDEDILRDVKRVLQDDPATDIYDVTPTIRKGEVTLSGVVPSWAAKDLTGWVASGVRGVRDIQNKLIVEVKEHRSDSIILEEIQKRLASDVWVNDEAVLLSVKDGVVSLNGVVGSVAEKRRVVRDAHVAGVKDVDKRLLFVKKWAQGDERRKSKWKYKSDEEIRETLQLAYLYDPRVSVFNLTITVREGIVTLSGHVDNFKAKRKAEETAKHTRGVLWVKNLLKVRPEGTTSDEELTRKVKLAIHDDPFLNALNINFLVLHGKIILHGTVPSHFQKKQAEESVSTVKGVVAVKNNLRVEENWSWKPDPFIKRDIESELWWSPYVDVDQVNVSVNQGVATLTGTVDNYFERDIAIENAREGGAKSVISQLIIRSNVEEKIPQP
ncbi:MAG: BON domain-containing protein [Nitrospirales bacterium]